MSHHHHGALDAVAHAAGAAKIALVGNPNVGKSSVFHALTGVYVEVSNYPGTTVDVSSGRIGDAVLLDTPGVYGISAFQDEERVALDIIRTADAVLNVVDAAHMDRDLFLTLQIIDMGFPTVVALNMMDEAATHGLKIDVAKLSQSLGVPVVPCVAAHRRGIAKLKVAALQATRGHCKRDRSIADAVLISEDDEAACRRARIVPPGTREQVYRERRKRADAIVAAVVSETNTGANLSTRIGRLTIHPTWGLVILAGFLVAMYYVLGVGLAQWVVNITEKEWMNGHYVPWIAGLGARVVRDGSFVSQLLFGEFGLLTMTVSYLVGLLLPLVVGFNLILSVMEDSGYLPRIAVLVDRVMTKIGLNGRAVIPMILGFGCVTMATITTRLMGTKRERTIATFLLALAIPCSAQLAVIAAMLAPLGVGYTLIFAGILITIYGLAGLVINRVLPGESSMLLIDLPPLRLPQMGNVLHKTYLKSEMFLMEAGWLFAIGSTVVAALNAWGVLNALQGFLAPVTEGWLGLPRQAANAFIMGFVRRDFGAAGLYDLSLTPNQVMVSLVTITLFVPCIASVMMMFKERGRREGAWIWAADLVLAIFIGGLVHRALFW